jgi:hypothetical protein
MNGFWQDLRYAARTLRNAPAFTIIAIVTLGLGLAVNTTIFSVINGLLLRPLPVHQPEQLVVLGLQQAGTPGVQHFSYPDYLDIRSQTDSFSKVLVAMCSHTAPRWLLCSSMAKAITACSVA